MAKPIKRKEDPFDIKPDCLFFSDLHLHDRKEFSRVDPGTGLNTRLTEGLDILDQIIEICKKLNLTEIFFLGDVFERKDNISNHILIEFQKRLGTLTSMGIPLHCLCGNHDFNLPNYPVLSVFEGEGYFHFINKPQFYKKSIFFIPFQRDWEDLKKIWKEAHEEKPSIICMHQEIPGGIYESGKPIMGVWDLKTDPDILYLSGHLHRTQKVHGIQFLGSPYQIKFSDEGQERFIWLYNSKTKQLRPYQLNYSKFVNMDFWYDFNGPMDNQQLKGIVDRNYIKIVGEVLQEDISQKRKRSMKETLEKLGAKAVIFNVKIKHQEAVEISKEVEDDTTIITEYAKKNVGGLDLDRLTKLGVDTYESL